MFSAHAKSKNTEVIDPMYLVLWVSFFALNAGTTPVHCMFFSLCNVLLLQESSASRGQSLRVTATSRS